jgi:hypothetical protein
MNQIGSDQAPRVLTADEFLSATPRFLAQCQIIGVNMRRRELNCAISEVANNRDISGRLTADEMNRGLRTGKVSKLWRIACSTFLGSLMVAGMFIVLAPMPASADDNKDIRHGREDNDDKGIRAEIAAVQAEVISLRSTVSGLQGQVTSLQNSNAKLQGQVTTLQNQLTAARNVLALAPFVSVDPNEDIGVAGPQIKFKGANIHIESGSGATNDNGNPLGLGNLIIGYDDDPQTLSGGGPGGGPPLRPGDRGGSHNLVIGRGNRFTQTAFGGLVAGDLNAITGISVSVIGGFSNTANGQNASVSGGIFNTADGQYSSVSGGIRNTASGSAASVSGGLFNTAGGQGTMVIGGQEIGDNKDYSIAPQPPFP